MGEELRRVITERHKIVDRTERITLHSESSLLAFRKKWPGAVVMMLMRAVMPKSMHGLDLALCHAQIEPEKWALKELRVCAALELLVTAADDKHKELARVIMMVLQVRLQCAHPR